MADGSSLEKLAILLTEGPSQQSESITHWHVLDRHGLDVACFLACWRRWIDQAQQARLLFYTGYIDSPAAAETWMAAMTNDTVCGPYAQKLARQWWGLLPGTHRLVFDEERVHLTLHVGDWDRLLPHWDRPFDAVYAAHQPARNGVADDSTTDLQELSRLCRSGTRLVCPHAENPEKAWEPKGPWVKETLPLGDTDSDWSVAVYRPSWPVGRSWRPALRRKRQQAVVIGAGLAGSAAAWSLAQRGWEVDVVDADIEPAQGASGLPAGLFAPHVSPDDSPLSQLTRDGVRATRARAEHLLQQGTEWALSGALEHHVETTRSLPKTHQGPESRTWLQDWSQDADASRLNAAYLAERSGLWHASAGWIRPAALVRAQLHHPRIRFRGGLRVLAPIHEGGSWHLTDTTRQWSAETPVVVLAAGYAVRQLLASLRQAGVELPLHALRGQVTWGPLDALTAPAAAQRPPWPVNGHGSFLSGIPDEQGRPFWIVGSTFEREMAAPVLRESDQLANLERLGKLLPAMTNAFDPTVQAVQAWAGVRCTVPDRLPAVGALDPIQFPGLHLLVGLGARGLTLSVLCGELVAAQIEGEPWPTHGKLAKKLLASRFMGSQAH